MLLFLDIDGVMVPGAGWRIPENLEDGFPMFSPKAVEALKQLISKDTHIILTTSHKSRFSLTEWKKIFKTRGLKIDKLSSLEPNNNFQKRKDEILNWFNSHPTIDENFVIIDDDTSLYGLPPQLKEHLIVTSPMIGLTQEQVDSIQGRAFHLA